MIKATSKGDALNLIRYFSAIIIDLLIQLAKQIKKNKLKISCTNFSMLSCS